MVNMNSDVYHRGSVPLPAHEFTPEEPCHDIMNGAGFTHFGEMRPMIFVTLK